MITFLNVIIEIHSILCWFSTVAEVPLFFPLIEIFPIIARKEHNRMPVNRTKHESHGISTRETLNNRKKINKLNNLLFLLKR